MIKNVEEITNYTLAGALYYMHSNPDCISGITVNDLSKPDLKDGCEFEFLFHNLLCGLAAGNSFSHELGRYGHLTASVFMHDIISTDNICKRIKRVSGRHFFYRCMKKIYNFDLAPQSEALETDEEALQKGMAEAVERRRSNLRHNQGEQIRFWHKK